ncbi:MAG TPA: STAS domain-containing protein [Roseiflexaceae bacterium]|nr:STAS domain-containing protein [Roseiflexaceae bacterium]
MTSPTQTAAPLVRAWQWLSETPLTDPIERQQAGLVRALLLVALLVTLCAIPLPSMVRLPSTAVLLLDAVILLNVPTVLAGLWLLRRGRFRQAVLTTSLGMTLMLSVMMVTTGLRDAAPVLFACALPIVLAGMLAGRRELLLTVGLCGAGIIATLVLDRAGSPLVGIAIPEGGSNEAGLIGGFVAAAVAIGCFVLRSGETLRQALAAAQQRERHLEQLRDTLEQTVAERTAHLRASLEEIERRSAEQEALLAENSSQREIIRELSVPVLPIDASTLVMPLVGALDSARLVALRERALEAIGRNAARQIILDVSGVPVIDQQVAHGLVEVVRATALLGAQTMLVGIRPEVAQALVALGIELGNVRTYRDLSGALVRRN